MMGSRERTNNVQNLHVNGVKKPVPFYTLDVIISVGYRVKSQRGVQFRQWANRVLKQYLVKGVTHKEGCSNVTLFEKHSKAFGKSIKCTKFVARTKTRMYEIKQYRGF